MSTYSEQRQNHIYYKYIRNLLSIISDEDKTIIDVGSRGVDLISHTVCKKKVSLDLVEPLQVKDVISIKQNFFKFESSEDFDIVCCFQVLEHIEDFDVERFAQKLLNTGKIIVVSVPFKWPKGYCKYHVQDPVDAEKIIKWFKKEPIFLQVVTNRLFAIFSKNNTEEILLKINKSNFRDFYMYQSDGDISINKKKEDVIINDICTIIDEYKNVVVKNSSNLKKYSMITFEELYSMALNKENDNEELLKVGIQLYPFNKDKYGHPLFLKEYIRFLVDNKRFDDAEKIIREKLYPSFKISKKQWWRILFARAYEKHGILDRALEIFSCFGDSNVEAKNAIKRIKEKIKQIVE